MPVLPRLPYLLTLPLSLTCVAATADESSPLQVYNLSPASSLLALPAQHSARGAPAGAWRGSLHAAQASHYVSDDSGAERVLLDGGSTQVTLALSYGLAADWEVQVELPWVRQDSGFMDSAIDGWHDFWGMPDNGRSDAPRDRLLYQYSESDSGFVSRNTASGAGDLRLSLQHTLVDNGAQVVALAAGYGFATGEARDFTGSDEGDVWLALRLSGDGPADWPLSWHGQVGYLRSGAEELLGDRQERDLWFAGASVEWFLGRRLSLLAQLDSHAAPLDSGLDALGSPAALLSAGARWRLGSAWALELAVVEDIAVETGPDVVFQAGLRYRPAGL